MTKITLLVNEQEYQVDVDQETPLLFVLRNDLGFKAAKLGCGLEQCGTCKVLVDGAAVPSCELPVKRAVGLPIVTLEGFGSEEEPHPLQEAFWEEQAAQCAYCSAGMIVAAQGLLNRVRYPTDEDIHEAFDNNLCRCGIYERVRRAIKLRVGRPIWDPIYDVQEQAPLDQGETDSELPASIQDAPDLASWIRINADETITIFSGKVELGQGLKTTLAQIAAEELDVNMERIRVVTADTGQTPDEGLTASSLSIQMSGSAIRVASAEARYHLLNLAFEELEAQSPAAELTIADGTITDPSTGRQITYWQLMGGETFTHQITGVGQPKHYSEHKLVGQPAKRADLLDKFTGHRSFVHDMDLPDMLHARVVRPPNYAGRLSSVDLDNLPDVVDIVRDGSFLAVIAAREEEAIAAANALRNQCTWEENAKLPFSMQEVYEDLLNQPGESALIINGTPTDDPIPPIQTPQTLSATYLRPYHMHGSMGPSAAVALWQDDHLTVWSHTQGAFFLQATIARVVGIDSQQVRIIHMEGAGCYGHNGADDVALDAALAARVVPGRPVLLKWTRADEHGWEPYGSAMVIKLNARLGDDGEVTDWNHDVWSYPHSSRPRPSDEGSRLLAAWHLEEPIPAPAQKLRRIREFGGHRNAEPTYAFSRKRVVRHFAPQSPLRTSSLRGLGAYANVFAIESFMDELALRANIDPVEFRLRQLTDPRARAVIQAAAEKAGWQPRTEPAGNGRGRGFAFAQYKNQQCYAAVVVDVSVDSDVIQLERAVVAADAGQVVNPDGISNQLEGGLVQAASWTLYEQVKFDEGGITSLDWESYPILHFANAPVIDVVLLNRPDQPFLGVGEATQNPTPAAIANAVFDAIGLRLREIPFTPERIRAARNG